MKQLLIILAIACAVPVLAITGKVVGVHDGDSLTLLTADNKQIKVRLLGIDAPELKQAHGSKAKQALSSKVYGKQIEIRNTSLDQYERTLADVYIDGRWINLELVQEGSAWRYLHTKDQRLSDAEAQAKKQRKGLWSESNPVPPWNFRAGKRADGAVKPITGYWLNENGDVRHNSNCKNYKNTKRGRACNKTEGRAGGCCGG